MTSPIATTTLRSPFVRLRPLSLPQLVIDANGIGPDTADAGDAIIHSAKIYSKNLPRVYLYALGKIIRKSDKHPYCLKLQIVQQQALASVEALIPVLQEKGHDFSVRKAKAILTSHTGSRPNSQGPSGNLSPS